MTFQSLLVTARNEVMFLQASVILLTGGGTSHPPEQAPTPREQTPPPGADTPRVDNPLGSRHPPEQTTPPGSRHPPGKHAVRYGHNAGGTHPTGMQSCFYTFHPEINNCESSEAASCIIPTQLATISIEFFS